MVFVYVLAFYGECHLSLIAVAVAARVTTAVFYSHNSFKTPIFLGIFFPEEKLSYSLKFITRWEGKGGVRERF